MDTPKPVGNPTIVLREEFDDWAILFNPDYGEGYALDPVAVFIYKHLDGRHTAADIVDKLRESCADVLDGAIDHCRALIFDLLKNGLAGQEMMDVDV